MPTKPETAEVPAPAADASIDERWNWVLDQLPAIGKDSVNKQQGFKFRSIDAVLDYLNPLLGKAGVHVFPIAQTTEREQRNTRSGGYVNVCYVTTTWEIRDIRGASLIAQTVGEGTDAGDKATSKAQTMAFKYLLWPSLAIAENEDPDSTNAEPAGEPVEANDLGAKVDGMARRAAESDDPDAITQPQINKIRLVLRDLGMGEGGDLVRAFKDACPAQEWPELGLSGMTKSQGSALIDHLKR